MDSGGRLERAFLLRAPTGIGRHEKAGGMHGERSMRATRLSHGDGLDAGGLALEAAPMRDARPL